MATVRIEIEVGERTARIHFSYDQAIVDLVKTFRGRTWHPDGRFWRIEASLVEDLRAALVEDGHTVKVIAGIAPDKDGREPLQREVEQLKHEVEQLQREVERLKNANAELAQYEWHFHDLRDAIDKHNRESAQLKDENRRLRGEIAENACSWADVLLSSLARNQAEAAFQALAPIVAHDSRLSAQLDFARATDGMIREP